MKTGGRHPLLEVSNLTVSYVTNGIERPVLDNVNVEIEKGETVALLGDSGCGKTTLALSIMRLLPANGKVKAGRIDFAGKDLLRVNRVELNRIRGRQIGFVFQEPLLALNPVMRLETQLCEGMRHHLRLTKEAARQRALGLLSAVGIADGPGCLAAYAHQISGGMRQRILIASALACDPELLICDEPSSALDRLTKLRLLETLGRLRQSRNLSILLISHDLSLVSKLADRILLLKEGGCRELLR